MIYVALVIDRFLFAVIKSYRNVIDMVYGDKKERSALVEWASKNQKAIMGVLFGIVVYIICQKSFLKTQEKYQLDFGVHWSNFIL